MTRLAECCALACTLALACDEPKPETESSTAVSVSSASPKSPSEAKKASTAHASVAGTNSGMTAPPDLNAPPKDAEKTASGLVMKVQTKGSGNERPRPDDTVRVHYSGWTTDGKMFDSSLSRGQPATFRVNQVIKGWTEALQTMVVGEKRRVWIPADLAYGDKPRGGAPSGKLVFDIELLEIMRAPDPPPVPEDVKGPPKAAKKTKSGLAYRVLKPGTGNKPAATDIVVVHYSGWKTNGEMFDSSVTRGQPMTFRLNQVIKGWTEGVQLMKVGEKTRFWIPADLAYGETPTRPGAPAGMLVFDVELLDIKEAR